MAEGDFETWVGQELMQLRQGLTLRTPSEHQSIFKYIELSTDRSWQMLEKSLNELCLVGSTSLELNDPFEASPSVFDDLDPHRIAGATRYLDSSQWSEATPGKRIEELFSDVVPYREAAKKYLDDARATSRIVAFCERPDSGLLWSHYASSYRGACLHFLARAFRLGQRHTFGYVYYGRHRPVYPLSLALALAPNPATKIGSPYNWSSDRRAESDKVLFFTKAIEWAYETELRLVYRPDKWMQSAKFEGNSLASIITGPLMAKSEKDRLIEIVRNSTMKDLRVRSARLSATNFSVEIE